MGKEVEHENITLYNGDMLDVMQHIGPVDGVFADPPFGTTQNEWDKVIPQDQMWNALKQVCSPNTPILLNAQPPFDKVLAVSNLKRFKYEWIWEKTAATGHLNAKRMPMKAHENVLVFYDKLPVYNPQKTTGHVRKTSTAERFRLQSDNYGEQAGTTHYDSTERYPRSVIVFPSDKQKSKLHPTQKPVALLEYLIKTYTNEGDTVLDFCMGSGTAAIACIRTNRKFIGIEKDTDIFKTAQQRIQEELETFNPSALKAAAQQ